VVNKCMGLKKGEKPILLARLLITSVSREPLQSIEHEDVVAEGFAGSPIFGAPSLFIEMFCRHMKVTPGTVVTRIEFEYVSSNEN
jgi:hypothetical protein